MRTAIRSGVDGEPTQTTLSGRDIICLARRSWHSPWKNNQQLMSRLAQTNRVLYVGPPPSLRTALGEIRARAPRGPILERHGSMLYVYQAPRPLAKSRISRPFNWITERLRLSHVHQLARRLGFRSPILWIFDPMLSDAVGTFGEKLVIYHVIDNYVECLPSTAVGLRRIVAKNEERMLRRADIVFAVSHTLHQRCLQYNRNSYLVPNGVDYSLFRQSTERPAIPSDVQSIPKPIIGYVGVIEANMNVALLQRIADAHPEWSLMLVGPAELADRSRLDALLRRSNVFHLGFKPVDEIPSYIKCCDVCIMPDDERTDGDSLKLYEYLACGRPVVCLTDDPSVRRFKPLVRIAHDASDFVRCIRDSLQEDPSLASARMEAAQENSWTARVNVLSEVIIGHLSVGDRQPSSSNFKLTQR